MISNTDLKGATVFAPNVVEAGDHPSTLYVDVAHHLPGRLRLRSALLKCNARAAEETQRHLALTTVRLRISPTSLTASGRVQSRVPFLAVPGQLSPAEHGWGDGSLREPLVAVGELYYRLLCGRIGQLPSHLPCLLSAIEPLPGLINE
jgi:hypothetical protein